MTITILWFPWGREIWLIHSLLLYGITILGGIYDMLATDCIILFINSYNTVLSFMSDYKNLCHTRSVKNDQLVSHDHPGMSSTHSYCCKSQPSGRIFYGKNHVM